MPVGFTPIFRINQEGRDITKRFNDRLTEIEITLTAGNGNPDTRMITLDDRDWKIAKPAVGRKIEIYLGYKEIGLAQQNVFEINTVDFFGPPRSIRITGSSIGFIGALKAPAIKDFDNKTLGDIIGDIAKKAGVSPMVEVGLAEKKVPFLNQTQSPLHLLQELERRYGAIGKFENGKLIFIPRDSYESVSGITSPMGLFRPEHLAAWSVRHSQRSYYSGVRAAYRDKDTHQPVSIEKKNPLAGTDDFGQPENNPFRMSKIFNSKYEAEAGAASTLSSLNRSLGEVNITLSKGDPWVRDHQLMIMGGMRDGIDGAYETDTVRHLYSKSAGLSTTILAKPPGEGDLDTVESALSGEVYSPQAGSKLGDRFELPVLENP